ncbi:MAG: beta-N-acetylglucosaminidase domain-containing protein [Victivallales bacterium]|nr:beta-N-acetylglucosaminidase domain-containing protein [Victivallales bacterium]
MSSVIQMTSRQDGKLVLARFHGSDWPEYAYRGYGFVGTNNWEDNVQLSILFKMNAIHSLTHWGIWPKGVERPAGMTDEIYPLTHEPPQLWLDEVAKMKEYAELGIEWTFGFNKMSSKFAVTDDKAREMVMKWAAPAIRAGGNYAVYFDDVRFPFKKEEKERFKCAADSDLWYVQQIEQDCRKIRPDAVPLFCPPFYWGPGSDPSQRYAEDRENYLRTIGKGLNPAIRIVYTGIEVFAGRGKKEEFLWYQERIRRRPLFYVNDKDHPHMRTFHYGTDPINLGSWFTPEVHEIADFVDVYGAAAWMPVPVASNGAYRWNPKAYDGTKIPLEALAMLVGKENIPLVDELNKLFTRADFCSLEIFPAAVKRLAELEAVQTEYEKIWQDKVVAAGLDESIDSWTIFPYLAGRLKQYIGHLKALKEQNFYSQFDVKIFEENAAKQCGWKSDEILLTCFDFLGGLSPRLYRYRQEDPRQMTGIRGEGTPHTEIRAAFRLSTIGGSGDDKLYICGQDDDQEGACAVEILLNGTSVFKGANPLKPFVWDICTLPLPKGVLKEGENTIVFRCIDKDGRFNGGRFFLLNYVVIK